MLARRSKPVIGSLTGSSVSGKRSVATEMATSPRSPLEFKIVSPRGPKSYDLGGVGLGIVAALERSGDIRGEIQASKAVYTRNLNKSNPIPVNPAKNSPKFRGNFEEMEMESSEDYTIVTCHRPDNNSYTKVYYDGGHHGRRASEKTAFDRKTTKASRSTVFDISPVRLGDFSAYPTSDFLSSCHLCRKRLDGKDIYMYRGEKAFCSPECRYRQIVTDERKEKCSSEASRSAEISSSPYANGQILSPGILAI